MDFDAVLVQVQEQLARERRIAYRMLKRRYKLDDEDIEDLKADLIKAKQIAVDEDGEVLVWAGEQPAGSSQHSGVSSLPIPSIQHLAPNTQAEAEGYFLKAIDIARKQEAKSWELRAVMSLVRLRQHQAMQDVTRITREARRSVPYALRGLQLVHRGIQYR